MMQTTAETLPEVKTQEMQASWESRMDLVKRKVGSNLNQTEWELFLYMAKLYDLNPLLREIWAIKFNNQPAQIFTGRDGLLKIAHKSGMFDGMKTVLLVEQNGEVLEVDVAPSKSKLLGAKTYVWRKDFSHPVEASVKFSEYDKSSSSKYNTWKDKPDTMIKKVAEAHCLRRTFSIHGLYLPEEFKQAQEDAEIGHSKNSTTLEGKVGEPPDESPEEQGTVDPVYADLPPEVQRTINQNMDKVISQLAEFSDSDVKSIKQEILDKYGSGSIKEMRYTELIGLYKDLSNRIKQSA